VSAESIEREIEAMRDPMRVPKTAAESVAVGYRKWIVMRLGALVESPEEFDGFILALGVGRSGNPTATEVALGVSNKTLNAEWSLANLLP
jgi:hypothetical protein